MSLGFIWLAASAGALSLVTPCVFPMVPITVTYFTQYGATSRAAAVRRAGLFGLGIVGTFTALGLALAALEGASAAALIAANPWVNLALTVVFIGFALNLFGVYHIAIPSRWLTAADRLQRERSVGGGAWPVAGAVLMGLTFALTSFTCTAPFVGTVLVTAAQGNWQLPLVGMLVYSTVIAVPFCLLAAIPQLVQRLPRAGSWLSTVKVVMGILELAAALKFLSNVDLVWHWGIFTRQVVLACWVVLALVAAGYVIGSRPTPTINVLKAGIPRIALARLAVAGGALLTGVWLFTGLFGRSLGELEPFLPPASPGATVGDVPVALAWRLNDYRSALKTAKADNKLVFIDFTGYTCTNCRWMEANMFSRPDVRAALDRFVLSRLFTDGDGALYERQQAFQQEQFKTVALPLYAIVDANGGTVATLPGLTRDPATFVAFLQRGLDR